MEANRTAELMDILALVRSGKALTRSNISKALSVRPTTISEMVGDLVSREILLETTIKSHGRGRPAVALSFNAQHLGAILVTVTGNALVALAIDLDLQVILTRQTTPPADSANTEIASRILALVRDVLDNFPPMTKIGALVFSLAGVLDVPRGLWCFTSRWPRVKNLNVLEIFDDISVPITLIRNLDAELAGIRSSDHHTEDETALLLHWGHGIGAAYSADGLIINQKRGRFSEIGHWELGNGARRKCACGNYDCLETVAAFWALGPKLSSDLPMLPTDEIELAQVLQNLPLNRYPLLETALTELSRTIANLCRLLFPDRIILTGPFVQNPEVFRRLASTIADAPMLKSLDKIRVSVVEVDSEFEIAGALEGPFQQALNLAVSTTEN